MKAISERVWKQVACSFKGRARHSSGFGFPILRPLIVVTLLVTTNISRAEEKPKPSSKVDPRATKAANSGGSLDFALQSANLIAVTLQASAAEVSSCPLRMRAQCIATLRQQRNDLAFAVDSLSDQRFEDPVAKTRILSALVLLLRSADQFIIGLEWQDDADVMVALSQTLKERVRQSASAIGERKGH